MKTFTYQGQQYFRSVSGTDRNCELCANPTKWGGANCCDGINDAAEAAGVECCAPDDGDFSFFLRADAFGIKPLRAWESSAARALEIQHDEDRKARSVKPLPGWVLNIRARNTRARLIAETLSEILARFVPEANRTGKTARAWATHPAHPGATFVADYSAAGGYSFFVTKGF